MSVTWNVLVEGAEVTRTSRVQPASAGFIRLTGCGRRLKPSPYSWPPESSTFCTARVVLDSPDPATGHPAKGRMTRWQGSGLSNTTWFGHFLAGLRGISGFSAALQQKRAVLGITLVPGIPVYSRCSRVPVLSGFAGKSSVLYLWSFLIAFEQSRRKPAITREYREHTEYTGIPGNTALRASSSKDTALRASSSIIRPYGPPVV